MASAPGPLTTTEGDTRYLRWLLLLDKGGTLVLRHIFDTQVSTSTLTAHLNSQRARLHRLKSQKVINDDQWYLLYPPSGRPPDSTTFDITLLTCLLRNICSLNQASPAWMGAILPTDLSAEADICRLRCIRNEAFHLAPKSLTEQEYKTKEAEIEQVLLRLGARISDLSRDINNLKTISIDIDCENSLLATVREWHELGTTLIASNTKIKEDVSDIKSNVKDLPDNISDVKDDVSDIKSKVENLPGNISGVKDIVSDIKSKVEDIPGNVSAVKEDVIDIMRKVENFPDSIHILKEDVSIIRSKVEDFPKTISKVNEDVSDNVRKEILCLNKTFEYIPENVKDIHSNMQTLNKEVSSLKRDIKHEKDADVQMKIEDLRHKLIDMYEAGEQNMTLVFMELEDIQIPVRDIYVPLVFKRKPNRNERLLTDTSGKCVESLRDMFYTDNEKCRHVVISGDSGYGKTMFCKHLVHLWCSVHSKEATHTLTPDEQVMAEFPLLFYIDLENTTFEQNKESPDEIANMLFDHLQLSELNLTKKDLRSFLQADFQVLVLMDAFDECNERRLPRGGKYNTCTTVITSRPWKLELLESDPKYPINQEIEIIGLVGNSSEKLVDKLLCLLNDKQKNSMDFIKKVKQEGLKEFLSIPVLLLPLFSLWFDERPFGQSETEIYGNIIHFQILASIKHKHLPKCHYASEFPFVFCQTPNCPCTNYSDILVNVSEFAFNTLLNSISNKNNLMDGPFSKRDPKRVRVVKHGQNEFSEMSSQDVDTCLKLGILTQYKLFGNISEPKRKTVGFYHRSYLEWFASAYMSTKENLDEADLSRLFSGVFCDLKSVLEFEKLFLFVCGQNRIIAARLSEFIMNIVSSHEMILAFRRSNQLELDALASISAIILIQNVIVGGSMEAIKTHKETKLVQLQDMYISSDLKSLFCRFSPMQILTCDLSHLKSIQISDIGYRESFRMWTRPSSSCIEKLLLRNIDIPHENKFFTSFSASHLFTLDLDHIKLEHNQMNCLIKSLASAENLRHFSMSEFICGTHKNILYRCDIEIAQISHNVLNSYQVINLKHAAPRVRIISWPLLIHMEKVSVAGVDIQPHFKNESAFPACNLTTLSLQNITLSHDYLVIVFKSLAVAENIKELSLSEITCSTHMNGLKDCILNLDLSLSHGLKLIIFCNCSIGLRQITFFKDMGKMEQLQLLNETMTHEDFNSLFRDIPVAEKIEEFQMIQLHSCSRNDNKQFFNDLLEALLPPGLNTVQSLVQFCNQPLGLRGLSLWQNVSTMTHVKISNVTMTNYDLQISHLASNTHNDNRTNNIRMLDLFYQHRLAVLRICNISIDASGVSLRHDMNRMTHLKLKNVTMTHGELIYFFFEGIASSTNLIEISINQITCSTHNGKRQDCIHQLDLSHHNGLQILKLLDLSIGFSGVKLCQNIGNMTHFTLYNVTMTHEEVSSMFGSVASAKNLIQFQLNELICSTHNDNRQDCIHQVDLSPHHDLENIDICNLNVRLNGLIVYQYMNKIKLLNLGKVTMSHVQIECLFGVITSIDTLKKLQLYQLTCSTHNDSGQDCIHQLDLSHHNGLQILTLWDLNVGLSGVCLSQTIDNMTHLTLCNLTMAHEELTRMFIAIASANHLKELKLNDLTCSTHNDNRQDCIHQVDLSPHHDLENKFTVVWCDNDT